MNTSFPLEPKPADSGSPAASQPVVKAKSKMDPILEAQQATIKNIFTYLTENWTKLDYQSKASYLSTAKEIITLRNQNYKKDEFSPKIIDSIQKIDATFLSLQKDMNDEQLADQRYKLAKGQDKSLPLLYFNQKAIDLYRLAASSGHPLAQKRLIELANDYSKKQFFNIDELIKWIPNPEIIDPSNSQRLSALNTCLSVLIDQQKFLEANKTKLTNLSYQHEELNDLLKERINNVNDCIKDELMLIEKEKEIETNKELENDEKIGKVLNKKLEDLHWNEAEILLLDRTSNKVNTNLQKLNQDLSKMKPTEVEKFRHQLKDLKSLIIRRNEIINSKNQPAYIVKAYQKKISEFNKQMTTLSDLENKFNKLV
ncbi:MAG: hypothetical protein H0W88_12120 [Parachlamydiaceae bacterium]|nr:hypothetical protein [Parachlamydiaceae bacterium]